MILVIFMLATIGMTNILVHGVILDDKHLGWRKWMKKQLKKIGSADLLECHECTGFWVGLLMGIVLLSWWNPLIFLSAAFAGSGLMHAYIIVTNFIESKTDYVIGEPDEPTANQEAT